MGDKYGRAWNTLGQVHLGALAQEPFVKQKKLDEMNPDKGGNHGLGVARVVGIDYEEHYVTLRTVIGTEQEFEKVPVPLTYPGAGCRHFLGAMPEIGDYAVIGWLPQESSEKFGGSMTPVILTWIVPGVWPGRDWVTMSNFSEEEHDAGTARNKEELHGIFDQIRHKLRHIQPGNIVASSSQGSDLVLDEDVHLSNRRGNEFILRDADQAAVLRALQQFTALAGVRTYEGMVQRDARNLPTTMISDGFVWDGPAQAVQGEVLHEGDLPESGTYPEGYLTPDGVFARNITSDDDLSGTVLDYPAHLDPYVFLRSGGYIDEDGIAVDPRDNDAVYGGKSIYRVGMLPAENTVLLPSVPTLTENRIEVAHTSDGRLPVTEQTDGFDAERLPPSDPDSPGVSTNRPYIERVYGSVVGNDPFSTQGRKEYGLPLVASVFDSLGGVSPRIEAAQIASKGRGGGVPLAEHAATLFKLTPISGRLAPTWWSINKQGQARINISGPPNGYGVDAAVAGGMRLAVGGGLELLLKGGIHLGTLSKNSLRLRSEQGPVVIYGGGSDRGEESTMERIAGTNNAGESGVPSVDIHARTNARLRAEKKLLLKAQEIEANAKSINVIGHDQIELLTSKQLTVSAEDMKFAVSGKRTDNFTGPKMLLPTNGALHERNYTPNFPGVVAEEVTYNMGDREEEFTLGSHSTHIVVGDMSYETELGTWKARALANSIEVSSTGISADATLGNVKLNAAAGSAIMKALLFAQMKAEGPVSVRSGVEVTLSAPPSGTDIGPVICAGSREPFTNLPFSTWGLGAKTVRVTP